MENKTFFYFAFGGNLKVTKVWTQFRTLFATENKTFFYFAFGGKPRGNYMIIGIRNMAVVSMEFLKAQRVSMWPQDWAQITFR